MARVGLRADGVEDEVGAEPVGRVAHGLERLVAVAEGLVRAERERALAPLRLGLEDAHVLDARQQRRLEGHQPDRPGAEHHRPRHRVAGQPEAHRVHAVGQRLDERADARGDAVGQGAHVGRRAR